MKDRAIRVITLVVAMDLPAINRNVMPTIEIYLRNRMGELKRTTTHSYAGDNR